MTSVFIATPYTRPFEMEFVASLVMNEYKDSTWYPLANHPIDVGRNLCTKHFLEKTTCDYILMADSDAVWSPETIGRLVERDVAMVCPVFFKRSVPPVPTMGPYHGITHEGHSLYHFGYTAKAILDRVEKEGITDPDEVSHRHVFPVSSFDLKEIDGCGMHFTLIRRDVVEKMQAPWFEHIAQSSGEDFNFCQKVRKLDYRIYMDLSLYVGHIAGQNFVLGLREFLHYARGVRPELEVWEM